MPDCDIRRETQRFEADVKAYDYRNGAHRLPALEADEGPYRLRRTSYAVWPPKERAYGGEIETLWLRIKGPAQMAMRLVLPVMLLTTLLGAAYLYSDDFLLMPHAPRLIQNAWLAVSDLVLPMAFYAFYAIHLTSRRYGASHAFTQLVAGLVILGLVALFNPGDIDNWINKIPALMRPLAGMNGY
jgi:hypothetical protein